MVIVFHQKRWGGRRKKHTEDVVSIQVNPVDFTGVAHSVVADKDHIYNLRQIACDDGMMKITSKLVDRDKCFLRACGLNVDGEILLMDSHSQQKTLVQLHDRLDPMMAHMLASDEQSLHPVPKMTYSESVLVSCLYPAYLSILISDLTFPEGELYRAKE